MFEPTVGYRLDNLKQKIFGSEMMNFKTNLNCESEKNNTFDVFF